MYKLVDNSGDIPFLSTDLSFNMTQLPRYKLVLDILILKSIAHTSRLSTL